jgi:hypothetical protein
MWRILVVLSVLTGVMVCSSVCLAGPQVLAVSPTYLEYSANVSGTNPASQVVSIWNSGHGPMVWQVTETCNWLSVDPNSGQSSGEVDNVNVYVDISGLPVGEYSSQLTVTAVGAANSPQIVTVNLDVLGPEIEISSSTFNFTAFWPSGPPSQTLSIRNSGAGTLNWTISESCAWLSAAPNTGSSTGEWDDVNLSVDIAGLSLGTYNYQLVVSAPFATNSPQNVDVNLLVTCPPPDEGTFACWQYVPCGTNPNHYRTQCHGDVDGDGDVDLIDWIPYRDLSPFFPCYYGNPHYNPAVDFERDFDVDLSDANKIDRFAGPNCSKKLELELITEDCLFAGSTYLIEWNWNYFYFEQEIPGPYDRPGDIRLSYSTNSGQSWTTITILGPCLIFPNCPSEYLWLVPDVNSTNCMLRISDLGHPGLVDTTWDTFSIRQCPQSITGDIDGSCYVEYVDVREVASYWLVDDCNETNQWCEGTDLDESTMVDIIDFASLAQNWQQCANPCDPQCR